MSAASLYRRVEQSTRVESASPHALVAVLLHEALEQIDVLAAGLKRGRCVADVRIRANQTLFALEASLDEGRGGTTATLLARVYRETRRCLDEAVRTDDAVWCAQARSTLAPIVEAWATIGGIPD